MSRPRSSGQRTPSGRLSRANAVKPVEPTIAFRARQAVAAGLADPTWGSVVGQLFLRGDLSASQYEAAKAYQRLAQAHRRLIEAPTPKTGWRLSTTSPASANSHPDDGWRPDPAAIVAEHARIREIPGHAALERLVLDDQHDSPSIPEALLALSALVKRWGVKVDQ